MGLAIGTVLIGMVRAASTARGAVARESELQAVTDALTGLGNRRHLLDQLDAKIAQARSGGVRLALSLIDLDGFKELDDTLGHYAPSSAAEAGFWVRGRRKSLLTVIS